MDLEKVVAALYRERELLDRAISQLEKLSVRPGDSHAAQHQGPSRRPVRQQAASATSD